MPNGKKRIQVQNQKIKKENRIGIMTHVVVGYPSLQKTEEIVQAMEKSGADFVELQIPFSDPIADGPTILKASQKSIENGTTVEDCFQLVKNLRNKGVKIPLLFMTYANIVLSKTIDAFVEEGKASGIDGFIIPDLSCDTPEGDVMFQKSEAEGLEMIPLFAPSMNPHRYNILAKRCHSLLYAVSRTGVTGTKGTSDDLEEYIKTIRSHTDARIALGFGIQSKAQIQNLHGTVDIAVVGSHLLRVFEQKGVDGVEEFLTSLQEQ